VWRTGFSPCMVPPCRALVARSRTATERPRLCDLGGKVLGGSLARRFDYTKSES
jgi:hypothetical protein